MTTRKIPAYIQPDENTSKTPEQRVTDRLKNQSRNADNTSIYYGTGDNQQ